ncbi:thiol reductant ABC exporter subunit CydD [Dictyobacter sp. S3.2.2.5]|uniref:Thiol reductant ABC exporter subunit CydD n=1 Tax=Dictyobacter halimunensis TaxID=3026934 RepID=A0ABQ6FWL0_9CHLR|nr:thiol reductant ABC exporter subunit CydD [Dictyobacter sp. S3.2.2.5]
MFKKLLRQIPEARYYLAIIILIGSVAGSLIIWQDYNLSYVVSGVFLDSQHMQQVWSPMLLLLTIILIRALLTWGNTWLANRLAGRLKINMRTRLLTHIFSAGPAYTRGERSGELINTIVEGVEALDPYFSQYLPQAFLSCIVPVVIFFVVIRTDLPSGIILLIMTPILLFLMAMAGMMAGAETKKHWRALSVMSAAFLDTVQGLTTLKLLGRSEEQASEVQRVSDDFRQTTMRTLRIAFFSSFVLEECATISTAIVAVEVGLRLLIGNMSFFTALFVLLLAPEFFQPLRLLATKYHAGMTGSVAVQRIVEILETPAPVDTSLVAEHGSKEVSASAPFTWGAIRLENVSYSYDGQRPALHDISFQINAGQKVALIGPSGAGKSTLVQILLRFIDIDEGSILVGDQPLPDIERATWREQVAWVPQHPYLFNATVEQNIRLGSSSATMEQVIEAARSAHADDFIRQLPQGYQTVIGERGARLSGGEAQRLSLARAFLKQAPLVILDEVTSYLDSEHESQILDSIARLRQGRTVLVIAHRLRTVLDADQIIVLDKGHLVARGDHRILLQESQMYQQLLMSYQVAERKDGEE